MEIPIDEVSETVLSYGRMGVTKTTVVRDTLNSLADKDKEMLWLYFFRDMPQAEIATKLNIPLGTVKSRLHTAKKNFKEKYPYPPKSKGENIMKKLPEIMLEYKIEKSDKATFDVVCEELEGMIIIPKLNEKITWSTYDYPEKRKTSEYTLTVVGQVLIHSILCVEIQVLEKEYGRTRERTLFAQLTDEYCRYVADIHYENGIKKFSSFLDEDWLCYWGSGENNRGRKIHISKNDNIQCISEYEFLIKDSLIPDLIGRYTVKINNTEYDTVCLSSVDDGILVFQYLDKNGRTVLWRRFNRDDWAFDRYKQKWGEKLPDNERLTVNGETYIHWYDCITDYIF